MKLNPEDDTVNFFVFDNVEHSLYFFFFYLSSYFCISQFYNRRLNYRLFYFQHINL